jgi:hypothetical protein
LTNRIPVLLRRRSRRAKSESAFCHSSATPELQHVQIGAFPGILNYCKPAAAVIFWLHLSVFAMERVKEYCDAVFELLLSDPEQSMDLATLGRHISKPSKKSSSRVILAADPRFNVTGTVVTLNEGNQADYDDDEDDSEVLPDSDASLRPIGRLPPPRNAVERAYATKINAAKRLPTCMLPSPHMLREWPHACIGPRGCPPLFPGPPLWLSDMQALSWYCRLALRQG